MAPAGLGGVIGANLEEDDDIELDVEREQLLAELKRYEAEQSEWRIERNALPTRITSVLIAERSLDRSATSHMGEEERINELFRLTHIRLDDCGIEAIDNLDCVNQATHLYLQNNRIAEIAELDWMDRLQHLDLSRNRISEVGNLSHLGGLLSLSLAWNPVETLDASELPESLQEVDLTGCPACSTEEREEGVRDALMQHLPKLRRFNGDSLHGPSVPSGGDGVQQTAPLAQQEGKRVVTDGQGGEVFASSIDSIQGQLLREYEKRAAERRDLVERIYNADVDDDMSNEALEQVLASEHAKFNEVFAVGAKGGRGGAEPDALAGGGDGGRSGEEEAPSLSLLRAASHHKNVGSASLDSRFAEHRAHVRDTKAAMLQRSAERRELASQTDTKAFAAAKALLKQEEAVLRTRRSRNSIPKSNA